MCSAEVPALEVLIADHQSAGFDWTSSYDGPGFLNQNIHTLNSS